MNMEFIRHGEESYFLEVNPRFSGGIAFSRAAGVNFVALELLCHQGRSIGSRGAVTEMVLTRRMEVLRTE